LTLLFWPCFYLAVCVTIFGRTWPASIGESIAQTPAIGVLMAGGWFKLLWWLVFVPVYSLGFKSAEEIYYDPEDDYDEKDDRGSEKARSSLSFAAVVWPVTYVASAILLLWDILAATAKRSPCGLLPVHPGSLPVIVPPAARTWPEQPVVLLIDDDDSRGELVLALCHLGYLVTRAKTIVQALELLAICRPNLFVVERLRSDDQRDVCSALCEDAEARETPVLMVLVDEDDRPGAKLAGATECIVAPFDDAVLQRVLASIRDRDCFVPSFVDRLMPV